MTWRIWTPWCTPVSVANHQQFPCPPSRRTSSLKVKLWFQVLEFAVSCTAAKYMFYCLHTVYVPGTRFSKTRLSCSPMRRQWKHAPQNSVFSPDVLVGTQFALAFLLQQLLCYWIEQRKSKSHYVLTAVAAELRKSYEIIFLRGVRGLFEPPSLSPCARM